MLTICRPELPVRLSFRPLTIVWLILLGSGQAAANDVDVQVLGVEDELRANVLAHIGTVSLGRRDPNSASTRQDIISNALQSTREALRPFGYYQPSVEAAVRNEPDGRVVLDVRVSPGEPIVVANTDVRVVGDGRDHDRARRWLAEWPLASGQRLDQVVWENRKQAGISQLTAVGFLSAGFEAPEIALDLTDNTADLTLVLDTGPRWVMGDIDFGDHTLRPGIIESIPRFEPGDYYRATLMDNFRLDLQRTGYFTDVQVVERRNEDSDPPSVDLDVTLESDTRDLYQGSIGFGSDTGIRLQTNFTRTPVSSRGDRIDIGIGWREVDEELAIRTRYRIPRPRVRRHYWLIDATARSENRDLEVKRSDEDENFIQIANGNIEDIHVRFGELGIRNKDGGDQQIFTTYFSQGLFSRNEYQPNELLIGDQDIDTLIRGNDRAVSAGAELRIVDVQGKGWDIRGRRDVFWAFTSLYTDATESGFTQLYASTRRIFELGGRYKFLMRGEVGYTDSKVDRVTLDVEGVPLELSVTRLPSFYRFRAGGSASVRGYGFEQLSNNNVGSNNLITASLEFEMRVLPSWSVAAFVDAGNAFNDWSNPEIKKGIGVGIRWYSIAGPIAIDFAQAMDFTGRPWQVHFTIGTPLL
jgi:translocation and assembly module TamA